MPQLADRARIWRARARDCDIQPRRTGVVDAHLRSASSLGRRRETAEASIRDPRTLPLALSASSSRHTCHASHAPAGRFPALPSRSSTASAGNAAVQRAHTCPSGPARQMLRCASMASWMHATRDLGPSCQPVMPRNSIVRAVTTTTSTTHTWTIDNGRLARLIRRIRLDGSVSQSLGRAHAFPQSLT